MSAAVVLIVPPVVAAIVGILFARLNGRKDVMAKKADAYLALVVTLFGVLERLEHGDFATKETGEAIDNLRVLQRPVMLWGRPKTKHAAYGLVQKLADAHTGTASAASRWRLEASASHLVRHLRYELGIALIDRDLRIVVEDFFAAKGPRFFRSGVRRGLLGRPSRAVRRLRSAK